MDQQAQFQHTEVDGPVGLAEMLEANAHDAEVCEFLMTAKPGDTFPSFVELRRVC